MELQLKKKNLKILSVDEDKVLPAQLTHDIGGASPAGGSNSWAACSNACISVDGFLCNVGQPGQTGQPG